MTAITAPVTESLAASLLNDLQLQQVLKDTYDDMVRNYADNGLLPQSLADEMIQNMTGAEVLKFVKSQPPNAPCIRIPIGLQAAAQQEDPPFHDNRPEFERRYLGRWQIGIDLSKSRDFTPTKD